MQAAAFDFDVTRNPWNLYIGEPEYGSLGYLIECADAEIAARLATDGGTAKLCQRAGERRLVVRTTSEKAFRKAARALGYGVAPAAARAGGKD